MNIAFDMMKALRDKTGLVQVQRQVSRNGKTFMQNFWVKSGDVKSTDKVVGQQPNSDTAPKQTPTTDPKSLLVSLLSSHGRDKIMKHAESIGVSWKKDSHPGINWMRASMAIKKSIQTDSNSWSDLSKQDNNTQNTQNKDDQSSKSQDDNQKPQYTQDNSVSDTKSKLMGILSDNNNDKGKVMELAKKLGVTWKENDKDGINWMRASMAIQKSLKDKPDLFNSNSDTNLQSKLDKTTIKVNRLENLIESINSKPTAKQIAQMSKEAKILLGLDLDSKSEYEKKNFEDILSKADATNFRNYRTLGMCAGDSDSEEYLDRLYHKYVDAVGNGDNITALPDMDSDAARNKLSGVVNKSVVNVVKSSTKNIRKRVNGFTVQQKIMEPWVDPNLPVTDERKKLLNAQYSGLEIGAERLKLLTETTLDHNMLHRVLNKLEATQEYGDLAREYNQKLSEYDKTLHNNKLIQTYLNEYKRNDPQEALKWVNDGIQRLIDYNTDKVNNFTEKLQNMDAKYKSIGLDKQYKDAIEHNKSVIDSAKQALHELKNITGHDLIKAKSIRKELFSPKFTDINANLYHHRMIANELGRQYWVSKDFVDEYPVLSKENIDKLETSDVDTVTNLALYAGMFKPSLSKNGTDAKDALKAKYKERQELIDTYGGVAKTSSDTYSENNEVRCKISKAPDHKAKEIVDNISKDWDKANHGHMKYKIKGVYEVSSLEVESQFQKIQKSTSKKLETSVNTPSGMNKKQTGDMFYHGTGSLATSLILGHSGQFKIGKAKVGRMLGDGIYLADKSSKSAQYISDAGFTRSGAEGSLMLVEAVLGNTANYNNRLSWDKNDSVYAGTRDTRLINNEWCVHNPQAVIPRYLVEMEVQS